MSPTSDQVASAIQDLLDDYVGRGILPGAAASIAYGTEPARFFVAGRQAFDSQQPVSADSLFRVMSMTKPIIGMGVMMLIEDGTIGLDQDIADFIPAFAELRVLTDPARSMESRPARGGISIRNLLTHTGGIGYFSRVEGPLAGEYLKLGLAPVRIGRGLYLDNPGFSYAPSLAAFAERLATLPLVAEPGTQWNYSMSPDLLGRIIEVASGMSLDGYLQRRLFDPLGMNSTFWTVPGNEAGRLMSLYDPEKTPPSLSDPGATSICLDPPPFLFGGSGLVTSPRDYDRFLAMLAGEGAIGDARVMRSETARLGMSNLMPEGVSTDGTFAEGCGFGALGSVQLASVPGGKGAGTFGWWGGAGTAGFVDRANGVRAGVYGQYVPVTALPFLDGFPPAVYRGERV